jgi:hypothetical protein
MAKIPRYSSTGVLKPYKSRYREFSAKTLYSGFLISMTVDVTDAELAGIK